MHQEFDRSLNALVDRDEHGVVRQILQTPARLLPEAEGARAAAAHYVREVHGLLGLAPEQLEGLDRSPAEAVERAPAEFRFVGDKHQFDTVTVAYEQTLFGLPVWMAGLTVQLKTHPLRVLSLQSTRHTRLEAKRPSERASKRAEQLDEAELARILDLERNSGWDRASLAIERRKLIVYRYERDQRVPVQPPLVQGGAAPFDLDLPTLELPPVPDAIVEHQHYVCLKIDFFLVGYTYSRLHWTVIVELETLAVLNLVAHASGISGYVFEIDPVTDNGGPAPSATSAALDAVRVLDVLPDLSPPSGGVQSLTGTNVQLKDVEAPTIAAPTELAGTDFDFDARTDNFAAVNAYYHCDKFFRLLDSMGFTQASFFGATTFPTVVDHRGSINVATGIEINAHCLGNSGGVGILQTTFALADLSDTTHPMGIASDYRVVLHELGGHGTLYNHVHKANFGFSHSAGDSIAAIQGAPASQAEDPFVSFPFVNIGRRHDRTPAAGWGWAGQIALNPFNSVLDNGGYNNEQILSTTHFRIYQSIGGSAADLPTRQFNSRVTTYLIVRGISTLTPATNPSTAAGWVNALYTADLGDWTTEGLYGGCYSKVIRWAFEKQGLYQPSGTATPNNNIGAPPDVDVYIDDGRGGEYPYQTDWSSSPNVWNRLSPDGQTGHQEPAGTVNYAYVNIKNRGTKVANGVVVKGFHSTPGGGTNWPTDLQPMGTVQLVAGTLQPNDTEEKLVGPFAWTPVTNAAGQDGMFMIVSSVGDPSNVDNLTAGGFYEEKRLVPNDNNIGLKKVILVRLVVVFANAGNFGDVCVGSFEDEMLTLSNSGFNLVSISAITSSSADFIVPGVMSYPINIGPGSSMQVPIRFQPTSFGPKAGAISIASNDPASPKVIRVSGVAGAPRLALIIADTGSFGDVCVGSFKDEMLTLSNSGHCTLTVNAITSSSAEFVVPEVLSYPLTIEAGNALQVSIRLQPASFGAKAATITVASNDPAGPRNITLSGTAPTGTLAVSGSTCFGEVPECCEAERTVSICNVGKCDLQVTKVEFSRERKHFKLINNPFPATLHPGSCLGVVIQYKGACDPECCELVITSDDPVTPVKVLDVVAYTRCYKSCDPCQPQCSCGKCGR